MLPLVLTLRFGLELVLLAVFGWWGYSVGGWAVAALFVVGAAVVWGMLLSPKAKVRLSPPVRNAAEMVVFLVAALGLATQGRPGWGVALVVSDVAILLALRRLGSTTGGEPSVQRM